MAHILVVDDDLDIRELLDFGLTRAGHHVHVAADGARALERVAEDQYDLMILDVTMPGISGLDVAREITSPTSIYHRPYIILLSALTSSKDIARGLSAGADEYVAKPFSIRHLASRVADVTSVMADQSSDEDPPWPTTTSR